VELNFGTDPGSLSSVAASAGTQIMLETTEETFKPTMMYPENITVKNLLLFTAFPTLVYQVCIAPRSVHFQLYLVCLFHLPAPDVLAGNSS
jgi:hypothetical protein